VACVLLLVLNTRVIRIFSVRVPPAFWLLIPVDEVILREEEIKIEIKIAGIIIPASNIASSFPALTVRAVLDAFIGLSLRGAVFWLSFGFLLLAKLKIPAWVGGGAAPWLLACAGGTVAGFSSCQYNICLFASAYFILSLSFCLSEQFSDHAV
jgi:hypothetical protein